MKWTSLFILFATACAPTRLGAAEAAPAPKPNIVFIMADDMGYGDVRCFNPQSKAPTPNLDRLAAQGMRFTDAHAPGSVCIPSRYGLLTGRYPFRNRANIQKEALIEPGRVTLASLLRDRGYATAMVGKWHLGFEGGVDFDYGKPLAGGPFSHGFQNFYGMHASLDIPPYFFIRNDRAVASASETVPASSSPGVSPIQGAFWREGKIAPGFRHEEVLDDFSRKAVEYVEERGKQRSGSPFFLYLALAAPHTPWLPAPAFRGKSQAGEYGDFVAHVDAAVGQVLKALDQSGLAKNTLVIFTSDNGPVWYADDVRKYGHASSHVYRGMKGDAWEGGHRMPFIARWPGKVRAGSTSSDTICFTDMLATFADLTGKPLPENAGEDSHSILPVLEGRKLNRPLREATVHQSSRGVLAIRQGQWKLIPGLGSGGFTQPAVVRAKAGEPAGQLYDLDKDPAEQTNLYATHPEVVQRLSALLEKYRREGRSRP